MNRGRSRYSLTHRSSFTRGSRSANLLAERRAPLRALVRELGVGGKLQGERVAMVGIRSVDLANATAADKFAGHGIVIGD